MGRWTINPISFVRNVRDACRLGVSQRDRLGYLNWFYNDKAIFRKAPNGRRTLDLRLDPPVGRIRMTVRDNRGADQLVFGEVMIVREYAVDIPPPKTVLDLGGNIGMATLFFARRWPNANLAVVEPMPENLQILKENLENNGVQAAVLAAAAAVDDGKATLTLAELDHSHWISDVPLDKPSRGQIEVEALSIPTILSRLGWDRIGFLKMDIEGYESKLLSEKTEWLERVDAICNEAFDCKLSHEELLRIGKRHEFQTQMHGDLHLWTRPIRTNA